MSVRHPLDSRLRSTPTTTAIVGTPATVATTASARRRQRPRARLSALAGIVGVVVSALLVAAFAQPAQAAAPAPFSIFGGTVPTMTSAADGASVELGTRFTSSVGGTVSAIRFYKGSGNTGTHVGTLRQGSTTLATVTFTNESASGWQQAQLATPIRIVAGTEYLVSYLAPRGHYAADAYGVPQSTQTLTAVGSAYSYTGTIPSRSYRSSNYYVDVVFTPASSPTTSTTRTTFTATSTTPTSTAPAPTAPAPSTGTNCAPKPSACGYPDATNTGVVAGTTLRTVGTEVTSGTGWHWDSRGWVSVDGAGAVLQNLLIPYNVDITASNVTLKNVRIIVSGESFGVSLRHTSNVLITDSEIYSPTGGDNRLMVGIKDIYGDSTGTVLQRLDIAKTGTGIQVESGLIADNFIHDMAYRSGDHINGITSNGGSALLTIQHNTILNSYSQTDAIGLFQDFSGQSNRTIDNNLLAGGGYTIYAGANPGKESTATKILVTNNRISTLYFPNGGSFGYGTAFTTGGGNLWSGNIWDNSGQAISKP